jgi:hypothetical protein
VALAAGFGYIEWVHCRAWVSLGKNLVRIAVATGARMFLAVGVHAALELIGLIGVAGLALDRGNLVGVGVALNVGVAGIAAKHAVDAGVELISVDSYAVSLRILQCRIGVASQALSLCMAGRSKGKNNQTKQRSHYSAAKSLHLPSSFSRQKRSPDPRAGHGCLGSLLLFFHPRSRGSHY